MPGNQQIPVFQFQVEFGGASTAAFQAIDGLSAETGVIEYREGSDKRLSVRKIPGLTKYANIILKRGLTTSLDLWQWFESKERRDVTIRLLDAQLTPQVTFRCRNAWPCKWELSELDATSNAVTVETLELAHEGFSVESA